MLNNSSIHKWDRLSQKQQDTQFVNKLQAGMNCSMFEAKAILNLVYEVYQPFTENSASLKPGQLLFEVVAIENSPKQKLSDCQMKTVVLWKTLPTGYSIAGKEPLHAILQRLKSKVSFYRYAPPSRIWDAR